MTTNMGTIEFNPIQASTAFEKVFTIFPIVPDPFSYFQASQTCTTSKSGTINSYNIIRDNKISGQACATLKCIKTNTRNTFRNHYTF